MTLISGNARPEPTLPQNRAERRRLAKSVVRRGDANAHVTREARRALSKHLREAEIKQREQAAEALAEERGIVVAKKKIWTPEEGS